MDRIHIEITDEQNTALAQAIVFRLEYLAQQPRSVERDDEIRNLQSFCETMQSKIKQFQRFEQN